MDDVRAVLELLKEYSDSAMLVVAVLLYVLHKWIVKPVAGAWRVVRVDMDKYLCQQRRIGKAVKSILVLLDRHKEIMPDTVDCDKLSDPQSKP